MIKELFIERPIKVPDPVTHKKILVRGFLAAIIYSIIYGIYEYFVVYGKAYLVGLLGETVNWTIMYSGLIIVIALVTRLSIQYIIMGLFTMTVLEDLVFWMCDWGQTKVFPFPAGNWWDSWFASYRVLGGWGQAIPFWPYVPFYYLPGFAMIIAFYLSAYKGAIYGRICAWMVGPLFLAIIGGTLVDDLTATYILIFVPVILLSYAFIVTLYSYRQLEQKSGIT